MCNTVTTRGEVLTTFHAFIISVLIRVRLSAFRCSRFILCESPTARSMKCCLGPRAGSDAVEPSQAIYSTYDGISRRVLEVIVAVEKQ